MKPIRMAVLASTLIFGGITHAMNTADITMATPLHPDFRTFLDQKIIEVIVLNAFVTGKLLTQQEALDHTLRSPETLVPEFNQWLETRRVNQAVDYVATVVCPYESRSGRCPRFTSRSNAHRKNA